MKATLPDGEHLKAHFSVRGRETLILRVARLTVEVILGNIRPKENFYGKTGTSVNNIGLNSQQNNFQLVHQVLNWTRNI